ncbi:MAG: hypothetical protein RIQ81_2247 [Pseudomonadota bacterium]
MSIKQILNKKACSAGLLLLVSSFSAALAQQGPQPATKPQPPPPQIPATMVSDWRLLGIDPDISRQAKPLLQRTKADLIKKWADAGSLEQFTTSAGATLPALLAAFAKSTAVSVDKKQAAVGASIVYEPLLCRLGDRYLIHISAADTVLGNLRGASHTSIDAREFEQSLRNPATADTFSSKVADAAGRITLTSDGTSQDNSALHIGMALGRETTRRDEGSAFCALALLAENLLKEKFTVVRPWGSETLAKIRNTLNLPANLRRPTRVLNFVWDVPRAGKTTQNPMQLKAAIRVAESVLGQPLPKIPQTQWTAQIAGDGQISLTAANQAMIDFLRQERQSLSLAEAPQVAKINRGWVYLDKGRAYGLEMDDRLVISGGPKDYGAAIKGHVVGFYGPEKNIKSPRGFPVNEGAIVFIRKGQAETKIGQTFIFDETVYPVNFPAAGR